MRGILAGANEREEKGREEGETGRYIVYGYLYGEKAIAEDQKWISHKRGCLANKI